MLGACAVLFNWTTSPAKSQIAAAGVLSALSYRHIGPVGNRVSAVTGVPGDPNMYYLIAPWAGSGDSFLLAFGRGGGSMVLLRPERDCEPPFHPVAKREGPQTPIPGGLPSAA